MIRGAAAVAVCLLLVGCTMAGARVTFIAAVVADAGTTHYGVTGGAREANPVLGSSPVPIMLGLAAVTVVLAEIARSRGDSELARKIYLWSGIIHGTLGVWNLTQIREQSSRGASPGATNFRLTKTAQSD